MLNIDFFLTNVGYLLDMNEPNNLIIKKKKEILFEFESIEDLGLGGDNLDLQYLGIDFVLPEEYDINLEDID